MNNAITCQECKRFKFLTFRGLSAHLTRKHAYTEVQISATMAAINRYEYETTTTTATHKFIAVTQRVQLHNQKCITCGEKRGHANHQQPETTATTEMTTTKTKTILLNFADQPRDEPMRYEVTFESGDFLRARMKLKSSRRASAVEYVLRKQSDGTLVNNYGVRFVIVKADRRAKKFIVKASGIDGRWEKKFATLAELQSFVRSHWEGVDYIDGAAEFHSDYVRFTLFGATLADLGARGGDYGTDGYWNWSWKQLDETVAAITQLAHAVNAVPDEAPKTLTVEQCNEVMRESVRVNDPEELGAIKNQQVRDTSVVYFFANDYRATVNRNTGRVMYDDAHIADICIAGNPARNSICGDPECVCAPGEPNFDEAELAALRAGFLQTWQAIGHDILDAAASGATEFVDIPRAEVIEATLDANYLEAFGSVPTDVLKKFRMLNYDAQMKFAASAFPCERYS